MPRRWVQINPTPEGSNNHGTKQTGLEDTKEEDGGSDSSSMMEFFAPARTKRGRAWVRRQRRLQLDNIQQVARRIEDTYPFGLHAYDVAFENLYTHFGESLARRIRNGRSITPLRHETGAVDRIVDSLVRV